MKSSNSSEVPTIFNPKKCRTSILTNYDEQSDSERLNISQQNMDVTDIVHCSNLAIESGDCLISSKTADSNISYTPGNVISSVSSTGITNCGSIINQCQIQNKSLCQLKAPADSSHSYRGSLATFYGSCCASSATKIYFGICVTICVTASWVGATHCIKYLYYQKKYSIFNRNFTFNFSYAINKNSQEVIHFNAPFFTTWFSTNWTILYFPVYIICQIIKSKCSSPSEIIREILRGFRDKGFTIGRFLTRCSLFCGLWVATNYMYVHSLKILLATDVMTLFATNVACVYLLSWVILHEQFVGVRIVAVILCDTGIALLAYMDGITGSPTLGGVVLAASAAAGSAVYKVLFKKVIGDTTFGQISLFFSTVGVCNAALLWPICLVLYFSGVEYILWENFPWKILFSASILHLVANMLGNFSVAVTYNLFITLGLITAVPVSAALDVILYGAHFMGMKLAGMILIAIGFFLVMFPNNWPDYFTRLLRMSKKI